MISKYLKTRGLISFIHLYFYFLCLPSEMSFKYLHSNFHVSLAHYRNSFPFYVTPFLNVLSFSQFTLLSVFFAF